MVHDEDRWVTTFNFLSKSWLLFEYSFKFGVIIFDVSDGLSETSPDIVVIFVFEDTSLRNVTIFKQFFMNILLAHKKIEVDVQHDRSVGDKYMFHVVVLVRSIFVPDEITNKTTNHETITAHLL